VDKEKCINGCTIKTRSGITWLKAVSWQLRGTGRKIRERLSHAFWGMEDVIYIYIYILLNPPGTKKWTERGVCGKR